LLLTPLRTPGQAHPRTEPNQKFDNSTQNSGPQLAAEGCSCVNCVRRTSTDKCIWNERPGRLEHRLPLVNASKEGAKTCYEHIACASYIAMQLNCKKMRGLLKRMQSKHGPWLDDAQGKKLLGLMAHIFSFDWKKSYALVSYHGLSLVRCPLMVIPASAHLMSDSFMAT